MFAMLEHILFEHDIVTLQEADKHPESGPSQHYRDDTLPDNLVYNEGVDWALTLNNWVLTRVRKEAWDENFQKAQLELFYIAFDSLFLTKIFDTTFV
jgi:hypothetical protein